MDGVVLVLNQNYEPLNVCNIPRAFRLVFGSKAEVIEYDHADDPHGPRTVYRAPVGDPPPAPDPPAAAAREADPARDLQPATGTPASTAAGRPTTSPSTTCVPRHRGGGHTWENLVAGVQAVQPPQGRPDARGGARSAWCAAPFEPRSDIYSLFTPYLAGRRGTRPGGPTSSSAGTEAGRGRAGPARGGGAPRGARSPAPSSAVLDRLRDDGHAGVRRRRVAARRAARPRAPRTGTSPPTPCPSGSSSCSPARCTRTGSGPWPCGGTATMFEITTFRIEHDYADFRRPHRVEFGDDLEADLARRDFTVNAIAWGGPADRRRGGRAAILVDPFGGLARPRARGSCAPSATRRRGSTRTRCGWSGRSASPRRLDFAIEPATLAAIAANAGARRAPLRRARRRGARAAAGGAARRRSGCGSRRTRACSP